MAKKAAPAAGPVAVSGAVLRDGARCEVVAGVHAAKSGVVSNLTVGATHGQTSVTVTQANGVRLKTLAKNLRLL